MSITKLKRDELQQLWLLWKDRCDNDNDVEAILNDKPSEESHNAGTGTTTDTISDTDKAVMTCDQAVNDNCHEGRHVDKILII